MKTEKMIPEIHNLSVMISNIVYKTCNVNTLRMMYFIFNEKRVCSSVELRLNSVLIPETTITNIEKSIPILFDFNTFLHTACHLVSFFSWHMPLGFYNKYLLFWHIDIIFLIKLFAWYKCNIYHSRYNSMLIQTLTKVVSSI